MTTAAVRIAAVSWLCSVGVAAFAAADPPYLAVLRLGEVAGEGRYDNVVKPTLATEEGSRALALPDGVAGRLLLAVARRPERDPDEPHAAIDCTAVVVGADGEERLLSRLEVPRGVSGWVEADARLEATSGASLRLGCEPQRESGPWGDWAQPILIPDSQHAGPLVVLISLDTLRADRVPGYGGREEWTPHLARLVREGLTVAATSDGTWTVPSHQSLMLGRFWETRFVGRQPTTLAEVLARAGFATVGITDGGYVGPAFGFQRGFDHYFSPKAVEHVYHLDESVRRVSRWLQRLGGAPTLLFLHTYAVHILPPKAAAWYRKHGRYSPGPGDLAEAREWYDGLVRRVDAELGPLFDNLRRMARSRKVIAVVFSDHGEAFMEHDYYGHGKTALPFDEVTRVPLIVWAPRLVPGSRTDDLPTTLADVAPSVLAAVGLAAPSWMRGRNLWPHWAGLAGSEPARVGAVTRNEVSWSLRDGRYKLIVARRAQPESGERAIVLIDLRKDPAEHHDIASADPTRTREMLGRLRARLEELGVPAAELAEFDSSKPAARGPQQPKAPAAELDETARRQLIELGYINEE